MSVKRWIADLPIPGTLPMPVHDHQVFVVDAEDYNRLVSVLEWIADDSSTAQLTSLEAVRQYAKRSLEIVK